MPELAIKVGDGANYRDGDILAAFNRRRTRCAHAQHICHVMKAGGGVGALRDNAHVARDWFEHTAQYRFERVSHTEIKRITLATLDEVLVNGAPKRIDGRAQHMDVALFVARRMAHGRHRMFGSRGREIWYGGRTDMSNSALNLVWNAIETKTAEREINFRRWPAGRQDLISHLFVTIEDFDETVASDLVSPELDETDPDNPITIKKRRHHITWRDVIATKEHTDIEDKAVSVDLRDTMIPLVRDDTVKIRAVAIV